MKKILAVGIIFLFIGVSVAPGINQSIVKASQDDDLVEVTTQTCGITGYKDTKVKLTREQYQDLEQYLVEFRARLNQTSTREEAVPIFKEAVVELDTYGLLPKGMSVEQAQKLIFGLYQNTKLIKYLETLSKKSESLQDGNVFYLIYGRSNGESYFQGPILRSIYIVWYYLALIANYIYEILENIIDLFDLLMLIVFLPLIMINRISDYLYFNIKNSPYIGSTIFNGCEKRTPWYPYEYYIPDSGNIWTIGAYDTKNWTGPFYGKLSSPPYGTRESLERKFYFPGVNGFIGLRLYFNSTILYIGFALKVNVCPEPPYG